MDDCVLGNNSLLIAFLELILVGWAFGKDSFVFCVKQMGMELKAGTITYLMISLKFVCPLALLTIFFSNFYTMISDFSNHYSHYSFTYENGTEIPDFLKCNNETCIYTMTEIEPLKWMTQIFTILPICVFGAVAIYKTFKNGESWKTLFEPTVKWVAADDS